LPGVDEDAAGGGSLMEVGKYKSVEEQKSKGGSRINGRSVKDLGVQQKTHHKTPIGVRRAGRIRGRGRYLVRSGVVDSWGWGALELEKMQWS